MLVAMVVIMVVIETIMMMAMVLGTLTKFVLHKDLAIFRLNLSIPAPPTINITSRSF
jgi:hypothetical protein